MCVNRCKTYIRNLAITATQQNQPTNKQQGSNRAMCTQLANFINLGVCVGSEVRQRTQRLLPVMLQEVELSVEPDRLDNHTGSPFGLQEHVWVFVSRSETAL